MSEEAVLAPTSSVDVPALNTERASIRRACARICALLSPPVTPDALPELLAALDSLTQRWARHVRLAEAPDGLLQRIVTDAPRLALPVQRLGSEHAVVSNTLGLVRARLEADRADLAAAGALLDQAMTGIESHRHRGNQVIYDAYNLDLGLGD